MITQSMKARYQYRFYPTDQQRQSLAQLFGCVRVVWNDALQECKQSEKLPRYNQLSALLTQSKKTEERKWLADVSSVPLQQSLRNLDAAYRNFFNSRNGRRKGGERAIAPNYSNLDRKIRSLQRKLARQQKGSNRRNKTRLSIAKLHNRIADTRKDFLHKLSTKVVSENQTIILEDLNVSGMVKNRRLARVISLQGWREFRTMCEAKSNKFDRDFRVISRWEPTSQICSNCGFKWGKLDLSVRSIFCINCGVEHCRDRNASQNIEMVGIGNWHDLKRAGSDSQTTSVANCCEPSRITVASAR
jgi:IS605 OrfB family transposase